VLRELSLDEIADRRSIFPLPLILCLVLVCVALDTLVPKMSGSQIGGRKNDEDSA
jgi:hypothetical protein